jgi:hypothetical protein
MKAFRRLSALLGCLAALLAILPTVAFAWTKGVDSMSARVTTSEPCPNCHDCDPCRAADMTCSQVCVSPLPTLLGAGPILPAMKLADDRAPGVLAVLHGLSPPPDPFPPRS